MDRINSNDGQNMIKVLSSRCGFVISCALVSSTHFCARRTEDDLIRIGGGWFLTSRDCGANNVCRWRKMDDGESGTTGCRYRAGIVQVRRLKGNVRHQIRWCGAERIRSGCTLRRLARIYAWMAHPAVRGWFYHIACWLPTCYRAPTCLPLVKHHCESEIRRMREICWRSWCGDERATGAAWDYQNERYRNFALILSQGTRVAFLAMPWEREKRLFPKSFRGFRDVVA
jgi:hypothetical protein